MTLSPQPELKEGEDFYLDDNGMFVFTAAYHLKRGTCCGNGCKHCPYGDEADQCPPASESGSSSK